MKASVLSFSARGAQLGKKIAACLETVGYEASSFTMAKYSEETQVKAYEVNYQATTKDAFASSDCLVFVGATGIAVRTIAPHLQNKLVDPAVINVDERGNFVIPLCAGHIGGANELARVLATYLNAMPCVTTATDVNGLFAVDEWAARNNMLIDGLSEAKDFAAELVAGKNVGFVKDEWMNVASALPKLVVESFEPKVGMCITIDKEKTPFKTTLRLIPKVLHLGIGCKRNTPLERIEDLVLPMLSELHIDLRSIAGVASVDLKKDEQGLLAFAKKYHYPINFYSSEELNELEGEFTPSAFVKSIVGVSNVCERSAVKDAGNHHLLLKKTSRNGVTLSIATEELNLDFTKIGLKK
ncbi:MAG: cobalt-precorrin 5A hydrolase [Phascolarctobacterium sp.]|nr:cobalt-precorrin 5A hydrolase [Phascolarctobacterium sp.]